jgi:hypothetical protein
MSWSGSPPSGSPPSGPPTGAPSDWLRGGTSPVLGVGTKSASRSTIFSLHPAGVTTSQIAAATTTLDGLRQIARDTYLRGSMLEALDIQSRVRDAAKAAGATTTDDYLFLGLLNYAAQRLDDGIAALREGLAAYPANAPMHENLAVFLLAVGDVPGMVEACERAMALGSDSPNVHDCLADG